MVSETRKQSMARMKTDYSKQAFSMEDKMAAGAFGHARNYGWDDPFKYGRVDTSRELLHAFRTFPGFMMPLGSRVPLICFRTSIPVGPTSSSSSDSFPNAIPCSPVQVPPMDRERLTKTNAQSLPSQAGYGTGVYARRVTSLDTGKNEPLLWYRNILGIL